jgi:NarL family two-component system response regulator LiaR
MKTIRVLIADDHEIVRKGLATLIVTQPDMALVGQAVNGREAVDLVVALEPDVVLLDLLMPEMDGLEAIRHIRKSTPTARILILTSFANNSKVFPAVKAGASGYLLKDVTHAQLFEAIRAVARGEAALSPEIAAKLVRELHNPDVPPSPSPETLTARELETLQLVAQGLSNREIARRMGITERTVAKYVGALLAKLHLANRTQAALYALNEGLAELE